LLNYAQQGRIVGLAFVAVYPSQQYVVDAVGSYTVNRALTRGMIRGLDEKLA